MAKKKEDKIVVEEEKPQKKKKVAKKSEPKEEKESVLKLVAEMRLDAGLVAGALNSKGLYLQFIDGLEDINKELKLTKTEFVKIIEDFKNGEL